MIGLLLVLASGLPPSVIADSVTQDAWADAETRFDHEGTADAWTASHVAPARARLDFAWMLPGGSADELAALDVLLQRLCNPVDGPLQQSLTQAGCWPVCWRHDVGRSSGLVVLSLDLTAAAVDADLVRGTRRTDELEQIVRTALQQAGTSGPAESELDRARALAARMIRNRQAGFDDWAAYVRWYEGVAGDAQLAEWELPLVASVRVGDVQRAAALLLEARRVVLPPKSAAEIPTQRGDADGDGLPVVVQLNPRVRTAVRRLAGARIATVETRLHGRRALHGVADTLMALGTSVHSVNEIREYLSYHGLDLFPLCDGSAGFVSRGPASHAAQLIELHAELVRSPDAGPNAKARAAEAGCELARWLAEVPHGPGDELYLPPGMYGWRVGEPPITDADLVAADLTVLRTLRYVEVCVAGDVEPDAVVRAVDDCWGDWGFVTESAPVVSPGGAGE